MYIWQADKLAPTNIGNDLRLFASFLRALIYFLIRTLF